MRSPGSYAGKLGGVYGKFWEISMDGLLHLTYTRDLSFLARAPLFLNSESHRFCY